VNPYAASTAAYQDQAVLTATPGQLVVLLYDGAIRFLRQADAAMGEQAVPHSNDRLNRAEAIIDELLSTLDMSQGSIAENLQGIYVFWKRLLWEVRIERDREKLATLIRQIANLREAWAQIAQSA
jgi:flagellar secretion chaperone FliS